MPKAEGLTFVGKEEREVFGSGEEYGVFVASYKEFF